MLGLHWRGQFYYDKCLPFGLRSSPFLFDTVASATEFIFKHHLISYISYLDDFLIVGPPHASTFLDTFTQIEALCKELGVATKEEKRTPPTTSLA